MSLKTRTLVFATFFGNCLVIGLLVAAFSTEYWVVSDAKRYNSNTSYGNVNFGLFSGMKQLNIAVGLRNSTIDGKER